MPAGKAIEGDEDEEKKDVSGKRKRRSAQSMSKYSLNYNEYIVYEPEQVKLRFLVQVMFTYR